jgi:hypothetical protein
MTNSVLKKITVLVELKIEVDPYVWTEIHGLLDDDHPLGYSPQAVEQDIRDGVQNLVLGSAMIEESEATVNEISPNSPTIDNSSKLVKVDDDYICIENQEAILVEIDPSTTAELSTSCNDGDILVTTDGDVFRIDDQGVYRQKQGPCAYDVGGCACTQTGREIINRYDLEISNNCTTTITCPGCTRRMDESI